MLLTIASPVSASESCGGPVACAVPAGRYVILPPPGELRCALVFFHGYQSSAERMRRSETLVAAAHGAGFALVLPDGLGESWSFPNSPSARRDDVAFGCGSNPMNRRHVTMAALALLAGGGAMMRIPDVDAGEIFEADGLALRGYDPVAYFTEGRAVAGIAAFEAAYRGATFRFASEANRALFLGDPARYTPQYGGFCAFGAARGYKAAIDPEAFTIVDGKLYLNYSAGVQERWRADFKDFIHKADSNWLEVSQQTDVAQ